MQNGATESWLPSRRNCAEGIESGKVETARKKNRKRRSFGARLDAGEMPPLHPFVFTTDYSPGDFATMAAIRRHPTARRAKRSWRFANDESVIRWGLNDMARYQKLSDELIVPNLDQDISFFYDPATKKLRKRFEIYPEALDATVKFANDLDRTKTAVAQTNPSRTTAKSLTCHVHHVILIPQSSGRRISDHFSDRSLMGVNQRCLKALASSPHLAQRFGLNMTPPFKR